MTRVDPAGFLKVSALGIEEQRVRTTIDFIDPVRSKNSSDAPPPFTLPPDGNNARVADSLAALNRPVATDVRTPREQQDVALPLMIPLGMEIFDIFAQGSPQGALAKEDHLG